MSRVRGKVCSNQKSGKACRVAYKVNIVLKGLPYLIKFPYFSELDAYKSKYLANIAVSVAAVPQKHSFFALPWDIQLEIYKTLDAGDLINFHLAFPKSTSELAPFYNLKTRFGYDADELWPVIKMKRVPSAIEENYIHAAYDLTLRLFVDSWKTFDGISNELRCKITDLDMVGKPISRKLFSKI